MVERVTSEKDKCGKSMGKDMYWNTAEMEENKLRTEISQKREQAKRLLDGALDNDTMLMRKRGEER